MRTWMGMEACLKVQKRGGYHTYVGEGYKEMNKFVGIYFC